MAVPWVARKVANVVKDVPVLDRYAQKLAGNLEAGSALVRGLSDAVFGVAVQPKQKPGGIAYMCALAAAAAYQAPILRTRYFEISSETSQFEISSHGFPDSA